MNTSLKQIEISSISIPFRVTFRHSAASRKETSALWVEISDSEGHVGFGEGCPREYVTGESLSSATDFVKTQWNSLTATVSDLPSLQNWVQKNNQLIDKNPAAWCAIELALLDLFARVAKLSVERLLGLPELGGFFHYTAVLGDADLDSFTKQFTRYLEYGFHDYKIKLSGDYQRDRDKLAVLKGCDEEIMRVRVDANNHWPQANTAIRDLRKLNYPFVAIEEPLQANDLTGLEQVGKSLGVPIVLDESFCRQQQLERISNNPSRWIPNIRISKMGGLIRSLAIADQARVNGIQIIIGAQVGETSLLTRAALTLANANPDILMAQEGAFGNLLLETDLVEPMLRFGNKGILNTSDYALSGKTGLGLKLNSDSSLYLAKVD